MSLTLPKHYYIESERVTTKLGGGFQPAPLNPMTDHVQYPVGKEYPILADALWERLKYTEECTGLNPNYVTGEHNNLLYAVDQWVGMDNYESNAFYYHSDHLGSSSLITDANGQLDQHYQYLPFSRRDCADVRSTTQLARPNPDEPSSELRQGGEPFVSQKMNTGVRFTFSAKERDSETGLSYFGARYYTSDLGIWLSVDPKAHWYPSSSAYVYTMNNPVNLIDPNGMWVEGGGFFNNLFFSDEKVVENMATKHANNIGGEVSEVDGGFVVSKVNYGDYDSKMIGEIYLKKYDVGKLSGQNSKGFGSGFVDGFGAGIGSTVDFFSSLGTAQGWNDLGNGMIDMAMFSCQSCPQGMIMRSQMADRTINYVQNIPNMSAYEMGYDFGFGTEKAAEALITRGVYTGSGVGLGSVRVLSNTSLRGTTLLKTGKNFRIDLDVRNGLHYHRRGPGGIGRHRPWEVKPGDQGNFWKRF